MPAYLPGAAPDGRADLAGAKWIAGFPDNVAAGLPALHALVIVNDPRTGVPVAILDGGAITAQRTAAVSGVAIARWAPTVRDRAPLAAIVGAGVQGRAHLPVLGHLLPGVEVAIHDREGTRATALAEMAAGVPGIGAARAVADSREAVRHADVVVTGVSFGPVRQVMTDAWFAPDALVIAIDYAMSVAAEVARSAGLFLVDEEGQFRANRAAGLFDDYPDPQAVLGAAIRDATPRPPVGRVVVTHLGVGLADLVFADAILAAATERGIGTILPR
jgi:ornithine cyclodeaminase/alanine dehydrogenase-like protein (mu-crystallin family)